MDIDQVAGGFIGYAYRCLIVVSLLGYSDEFHVGQNGPLQEFVRNHSFEIGLENIFSEQYILALLHADMDHIVVINIVHLETFLGIFRTDNLDLRRVDVDISSISCVLVENHLIFLNYFKSFF